PRRTRCFDRGGRADSATGCGTGPSNCTAVPAGGAADRSQAQSEGTCMDQPSQARQWTDEEIEEIRKIRRLQLLINRVMSTFSQSPDMTVEEASELVAGAKRAALAMFPD